jgi:hypothetical protein
VIEQDIGQDAREHDERERNEAIGQQQKTCDELQQKNEHHEMRDVDRGLKLQRERRRRGRRFEKMQKTVGTKDREQQTEQIPADCRGESHRQLPFRRRTACVA